MKFRNQSRFQERRYVLVVILNSPRTNVGNSSLAFQTQRDMSVSPLSMQCFLNQTDLTARMVSLKSPESIFTSVVRIYGSGRDEEDFFWGRALGNDERCCVIVKWTHLEIPIWARALAPYWAVTFRSVSCWSLSSILKMIILQTTERLQSMWRESCRNTKVRTCSVLVASGKK